MSMKITGASVGACAMTTHEVKTVQGAARKNRHLCRSRLTTREPGCYPVTDYCQVTTEAGKHPFHFNGLAVWADDGRAWGAFV